MRLAIPALLLAALTLQATPVPFLDGAGITSILNSVDATRITGDVDLTPGRFLHIPGYSSVSLLIEWLVIANASQPAPYLGAFDWTWDGPEAGRHLFALEYTIPAQVAGVPEPGTAASVLFGAALVFLGQWTYAYFNNRKRKREYQARLDAMARLPEYLGQFSECGGSAIFTEQDVVGLCKASDELKHRSPSPADALHPTSLEELHAAVAAGKTSWTQEDLLNAEKVTGGRMTDEDWDEVEKRLGVERDENGRRRG